MKAKRILALMFCILILVVSNAAYAGVSNGYQSYSMYSSDGRVTNVPGYAVGTYQNAGWSTSKEDVITTMYAEDGRTITVYKSQVEDYKNVGWYESLEDVTKVMYAPDGRTVSIYKSEVEAYKKVGWYESIEDVTTTMYAMDGRTITVYNDQVEDYKKVGWYDDYADVSITLYSKDGRQITVLKQDKDAYLKVGWYDSPRCIDPNAPMIAITFDDGPSKDATTTILNALENHHAVATFFVQGKNAAAYPNQIKREVELGCEVANHTYNHPKLTTLSSGAISTQVSNTDTAVYNACGVYPKLLRPPGGSYNDTVRSAVGKPLILWSIDTRDWQHRNADTTYNNVMSNVKDGDIILMHDLYPATASAAIRLIPALQAKGFQLVTVSELARYKGVTLQNGVVYNKIR